MSKKQGLPEFPNGFTEWKETFYEVVVFITETDMDEESEVSRINSTEGTGGLYDLATDWTNEFEKLHKGRIWDGDFFDALEDFCTRKNRG